MITIPHTTIFVALLFLLLFQSIFAVDSLSDNALAFETWKFSDYEDYDIVKWGTQRGLCPESVGFCGVEPELGQSLPEVDREECDAREKDTKTVLNNILKYKNVFCGTICTEATDCAPDESCCADPCGKHICVKAVTRIPRARRQCPKLLQRCKNKNIFRCIRADQFCNGVNDCDDNSDEDESACQRHYEPVFKYGIQNGSGGLPGITELFFLLTTTTLLAVF